MPASRVYTPDSADDARGLLEDGLGSVVILIGDARTRATSACLDALSQLAGDYDPDQIMFAHVDAKLLPTACGKVSLAQRGTTEGCDGFPALRRDGAPTILSCRDGEILEASVGRQCCVRLRRQVDRLLRDDPGPCLLTRLFRFASGA